MSLPALTPQQQEQAATLQRVTAENASSVACASGSVSPSYQVFLGAVPADVLDACADLFSAQYGVWSRREENASQLQRFKLKPGTRVRMNAARLQSELLFDARCGVVVARVDAVVVGHAFFTRFPSPAGTVRWITQLVVHEQWRRQHIATVLLIMAIGGERDKLYAMALVSSHPYAVRALESATGVRCTARVNQRIGPAVLQACTVPYLARPSVSLSADACSVNTSFLVDHAGVLELLAKERANSAADPARAWRLGELAEGHEFLALVELPKTAPPRSDSKPQH